MEKTTGGGGGGGAFSLVLERPFSPFPIHQLSSDFDLIFFNRGRVPTATWSKTILSSAFQGNGNSGFVTFSSKFLTPHGWNKLFNHQIVPSQQHNINLSPLFTQIVSIFTEQEPGDGEWSHGSFPLEEYIMALNRSKGELYYNHSLGMGYSKVRTNVANLSFAMLYLLGAGYLLAPSFILYLLPSFVVVAGYRANICGIVYTNTS